MSHTLSLILQKFLEFCQPSPHQPLGFLMLDEDVYRVPAESGAVLDALTANFADDELVESGLLTRGEEGEPLTLSPEVEAEKDFIVLRDVDSGEPFDLLTSAGCLAPAAIPVFEVLRDRRTQELLAEGSKQLPGSRQLIVAFDLESVLILRACGLPATLAVGMDDMPLDSIDQFNDLFGFQNRRPPFVSSSTPFDGSDPSPGGASVADSPPGEDGGEVDAAQADPFAANDSTTSLSDSQPERRGASLVFLGWMLSDLSLAMPVKLKIVVDHLQQLDQYVGLDLFGIRLWEISGKVIDGLRFVADRNHAPSFQQIMQQEAETIIARIDRLGREPVTPPGPPADYSQALARLRETASRKRRWDGLGRDPRKQAWDDVQHFLHERLVDPLREQALTSEDLLQRALLMGCAELASVFHAQSIALNEQLSRHMAESSGSGSPLLTENTEKQFKNLMATTDRLLGLAKEASPCQKSTMTRNITIDSKTFPRLPHSG